MLCLPHMHGGVSAPGPASLGVARKFPQIEVSGRKRVGFPQAHRYVLRGPRSNSWQGRHGLFELIEIAAAVKVEITLEHRFRESSNGDPSLPGNADLGEIRLCEGGRGRK